jgi:Mg2+/Co2+ transporter CorB
MHLLGMRLNGNQNTNMQEEFEGAIKYQKQYSKNNKEQIEYMSNLLELKNLKVDELMTHRNDISYINLDDSIDQIINQLKEINFTRVPVIKKNFDSIEGILDIRDLLKSGETLNDLDHTKIAGYINKPWFIPENKMAIKQLIDFKSKREHMAMIVDEYGAVQGLISLEDIIEEIIGEIFDETDVENSYLEKIDSNNYIFNGNASIRELNRVLKINLPDEFVTLSGLVYSITNDIPKVGKVLNYQDIKIQIISKSVNKISKIKITI